MDVRRMVLQVAILLLGYASASTAAAPEIKRVAVGDTELSYIEAGAGDPVVLVHGPLQDYRVWEPHLEALTRKNRVIAYSRRNHFPNTVSVDGAPDGAADQHGADLAALITALGLSRVHVVAHSSGAHAALYLASERPDLVRALVVNEPPAITLLRDSPLGVAMVNEFYARLAPSRDAFLAGDMPTGVRLFAEFIGNAQTFENLSGEARTMMMDNAAAQAADAAAKRRLLFTCEMARRVAAPTLITSGTRSQQMFLRIIDELRRCLPKSEHVPIDAFHDVPMENPRAFDKAVTAFLGKQR